MNPRVVLAYTGQVDTAICLQWLRQVQNYEVVVFVADLGQAEYLEPYGEAAIELGASSAQILDLREKFLKEFCFPALRAGATYEHGYLLSAALSRPALAGELVRVATEEGCDLIAHGCRGKGNDQQRFEACFRELSPDIGIIAPLEHLHLRNPQDDLEYARQHGLPIERTKQALYNVDSNLWGVSLRLDQICDLWSEPPRDSYFCVTPLDQTPDRPVEVTVSFDGGIPVSLDGEALPPVDLVATLNRIGGRHGVGRLDVVEDRLSGAKSRELYESPAAFLLHLARTALEEVVLPRETLLFMEGLSRKYGELVYTGRWFSDMRRALDSAFSTVQSRVTGDVRLKLFRGAVQITGRRSPNALYAPAEIRVDTRKFLVRIARESAGGRP